MKMVLVTEADGTKSGYGAYRSYLKACDVVDKLEILYEGEAEIEIIYLQPLQP